MLGKLGPVNETPHFLVHLGFRIPDLHRFAIKIICEKTTATTFMGVTINDYVIMQYILNSL